MPTGIYKHKSLSEEHKGKLREAQKKNKDKISKALKGRLPWNKGLTKETDERIKKTGIFLPGSQIGKDVRKGCIPWNKGKGGDKAPNWKGGITPIIELIRSSIKYREWRSAVFIRDNFTCLKCNQRGGRLEVHHKKSFKNLFAEARGFMPLLNPYDAAMIYTPLWDISNGKTFCEKCHHKTKKDD